MHVHICVAAYYSQKWLSLLHGLRPIGTVPGTSQEETEMRMHIAQCTHARAESTFGGANFIKT